MDEAYYKLAVWLNDKGKLQSFTRVGQKSIMSLLDLLTANTFLFFFYYFLFLRTENYRLQSKYENHLIAKVALFQFVNSFLSLFYIAFYLRDEEKLKEVNTI